MSSNPNPSSSSNNSSAIPSQQQQQQQSSSSNTQQHSSNAQSQHQNHHQQQQQPQELPFNLNRLVQEYLTRKGYHQTESTLRIESTKIPGSQNINLTNSNTNYNKPSTATSERSNLQFQLQKFKNNQNISLQRQFDEDPNIYARSYLLYRTWCDNSLEMYKYELKKFLYPFFIYSYLALIERNETKIAHDFLLKFKSDHIFNHNEEFKNLLKINLQSHLNENKFAKIFLSNKYKLNISNTSLNLILGFINENQAIGGGILIRFLNNNFEINTQIEVTTSSNDENSLSLNNLEGIPEIYELINLSNDKDETTDNQFKSSKSSFISNKEKPLKLGPYPQDEEFTKELEAELKHRDENAKNDNNNNNNNNNNNTNNENDDTPKKTLMEEYNENFKIDPKNDNSPAKNTLPLPQKTVYDLKRAIQEIHDSRSKIKLSSASYSHLNADPNNRKVYISQPSLPSVCMYTFQNTNNDLNSLEYHPDYTMIAGGFQDSFIKLWSIDGSPLKSVLKNDPHNYNNVNLENNSTRRLIGHSGPVYGMSFSPDGKYLLSSSADSTVRLWSMDTYTSLVSYKGHGGAGGAGGSNSPVWDVEFSPLGHYFATASHDQTARLWSCDHIYPLRIFAGHLNDVDIVKFHPNGTYLFTGSSDKTIRMWDIAKGESVRLFVGHTSPINDIACSPDGRWLATCSVNEENYLNNSFGVSDWTNSIGGGFTPSGGSNDKNSNDTNDESDKNTKDKNGKDKNSKDKENNLSKKNGSSYNEGNLSFTGSVIHVWDIASGRKLKTMRGHGSGGIHSLAWSRDGEVLVSGGADNSVRVWDAKRDTIDIISGSRPETFNTNSNSNNNHVKGDNNKGKNNVKFGSDDHMGVYFTKKTPIYKVEFTRRNLCLAAGPFMK
ncbi:chromatin modification protein [Pichia kluyveri]|uniref:Chromatin modification protein n=1 Tax=Pichia kluyveri TaxID=36015 RepID=A0AAV5R5Z4_PICKL|nr:chromatin modification protein [Pichia kluyveri]